ncbi:MAG: hypothetical protein OSB47_10700, partial [Pirellulaceae bacterium]|nr:hypothetical protein [Pirellulaceae bacterium]
MSTSLLNATLFMALFTCPLAATAQEVPAASKPEALFEELWSTFSERYAFFKLRGVDWKAQRNKYRPQVKADTTDDQLFDIFLDIGPTDIGQKHQATLGYSELVDAWMQLLALATDATRIAAIRAAKNDQERMAIVRRVLEHRLAAATTPA